MTDAEGAFSDLAIQVSVSPNALRLGSPAVSSIAFPVGDFTRRSLPAVTGGIPPYRYALDRCPLDWLHLVGTELAGNPPREQAGERRLCGYRATDAEGAFSDLVLEISASPIPLDAFQFENRHIVDRDFPVGFPIEPIVLPRALNATGEIAYELDGVLPPGLELACPGTTPPDDSPHPICETGTDVPPRIQGTPTDISILTRYCLHATDAAGATAAPRCFHLRTVDHEVPRFTVNLDSGREVLLFRALIASTVPEEVVDPNMPLDSCERCSHRLPVAHLPPEWDEWEGNALYSITPAIDPFVFDPNALTVTSPSRLGHPIPTPVVYTYGVRHPADDDDTKVFAAAICFELGRRVAERTVSAPSDATRVYREDWFTITYHDEAVQTSTGEYVCHPNPRGDDDPGSAPPPPGSSGPTAADAGLLHDALGLVHARRAARLAHELIGERVRDASPGGRGAALHSDVDFAWLSGRTGGFSYSGSGESLLAGGHAALPDGVLRLGLVGGFHRTTLDYRAETPHLAGRFSAGEHATELVSMHPFLAWRFASGGVAWGSVGAGAGRLAFEDAAPPFDARRRADLALRAAALGFRHPLASSPLGTFSFSGLAERVALRIGGDGADPGSRPRSLAGSDLALGLDWRRPPAGAEAALTPSLSLGFRRQTGDGASGSSLLDASGALAYRPAAKTLSLDVAASALVGVAGDEARAFDVRAAARLDPSPGPRGLELSLRSTLATAAGDGGAAWGLDGELGYGVFGRGLGGTVRPYVALSRFGGLGGVRRAAGLHLRDEPGYRLSVEAHERSDADADGVTMRLRRSWP